MADQAKLIEYKLGAAHPYNNLWLPADHVGIDPARDGGAFIASDDLLPIGTPVYLLVAMPGGYTTEATGKVAWHTEGPGPERGFAVRIDGMPDDGKELFRRYSRGREPLIGPSRPKEGA
jgi:hypothetical protein